VLPLSSAAGLSIIALLPGPAADGLVGSNPSGGAAFQVAASIIAGLMSTIFGVNLTL
jgi:hypothetical protein